MGYIKREHPGGLANCSYLLLECARLSDIIVGTY